MRVQPNRTYGWRRCIKSLSFFIAMNCFSCEISCIAMRFGSFSISQFSSVFRRILKVLWVLFCTLASLILVYHSQLMDKNLYVKFINGFEHRIYHVHQTRLFSVKNALWPIWLTKEGFVHTVLMQKRTHYEYPIGVVHM